MDITEEGKKCKITQKNEQIQCVIICSFKTVYENGNEKKKYRLKDKEGNIIDNVNPSELIFN
jgi:hypothetical protein